MKKTGKLLLMAIGMAGLCIGCNEGDNGPSAPVDIRFELLNEAGEPSTTFREGEDIIFDYRIVNLSDGEIVWYFTNDLSSPAFPVFKVYRLFPVSSELPDGTQQEIGTTHAPQIFYAKYGNTLVSQGEKRVRVTWLGDVDQTKVTGYGGSIKYPENNILPKGEYYVEFEHSINFAQYEDMHVHFKKLFEVL